jgi:hypothetical protein
MGEETGNLLEQFLGEKDPSVAQNCLEELLAGHVEPVVDSIIRYKSNFWGSNESQDRDDIKSEVMLLLIIRLEELRTSGARSPIEDFRGYVAATTYNTYHKYVRMKYPSRYRLKNRIRYLLNHTDGLATWKGDQAKSLCGLAAWRSSLTDESADKDHHESDLDGFLRSLDPGKSASQMSLGELTRSFLFWRGRPVQLDELVGIVAELHDIQEPQQVTAQSEDIEGGGLSICELLPDPGLNVLATLEQRSHLELLWKEIGLLPQRQRVALLLNLRDAQAGDALILFTLAGIASMRCIAEAIEMPSQELAELWNKLPLEDIAIAGLLGITRQQVINLRKSARERLARRVAALRA